MTPDIRTAARLVDDPCSVMWFDAGRMPEYSSERPLNAERLMRPPFDSCALVGRDADGDLFVITTRAAENSLAIAGLTRTLRGVAELSGFAVVLTEDGSLALHRAKDQQQARAAIVIIDEWLARLDTSGCESYQPSAPANTINRQRAAKGKRPLYYTWRTVVVAPRNPKGQPQGGTHASPRAHDRRGHWRKHSTRGQVWVKNCRVGDASKGSVFKDYKVPT